MCKPVGAQGASGTGGITLGLFVLRSRARQKPKCCSEHFCDLAVGNQPRSSESKRKVHVRGPSADETDVNQDAAISSPSVSEAGHGPLDAGSLVL
jgi:hypothetical protein